jgi:hypothetical protein
VAIAVDEKFDAVVMAENIFVPFRKKLLNVYCEEMFPPETQRGKAASLISPQRRRDRRVQSIL